MLRPPKSFLAKSMHIHFRGGLFPDAFQKRIKLRSPEGCQGAKKSVCSETELESLMMELISAALALRISSGGQERSVFITRICQARIATTTKYGRTIKCPLVPALPLPLFPNHHVRSTSRPHPRPNSPLSPAADEAIPSRAGPLRTSATVRPGVVKAPPLHRLSRGLLPRQHMAVRRRAE